MFSLREGLKLEISKLSRIRSSILEKEWQDEIGEIVRWNGVMSMVDVCKEEVILPIIWRTKLRKSLLITEGTNVNFLMAT